MKEIWSLKYVGWLYIITIICEILYKVLDVVTWGDKMLPFGWGAELISILIRSLLDLVILMLVSFLVTGILDVFNKKSINATLLITVIFYVFCRHILMHN